jgi:hypothetical protein
VSRRFLERIGLGHGPGDPRFARVLVWIGCAAYALGFALFYPQAITNDDEAMYLRQTQLLLEGRQTIQVTNALTGETLTHDPSKYPVGTAALMAPFVAAAGWRGAYVLPCLSLVLAVLMLARWLEQEGRSPIYALLVLGYAPTLVMGRVAMSDVPSLALVTAGLWWFWRGLDGRFLWWLGSGFLAGAGWVLRESNPIPFAPFYLGALLRRDRNVWALVAGGVAGVSLRLLANWLIHGDVMFVKANLWIADEFVPEKLTLYAIAVLVLVPGGLVFSLAYRGRRWPEACVAILAFVGLYVAQEYWTYATSWLRNLIITPRYLIPIVPLMAFAMAEALPRLWRRFAARAGAPFESIAGGALACWAGAVLIAAFAVHPTFHTFSAVQGRIQATLDRHIDRDGVLITNLPATRKFLRVLEFAYLPVDRHGIRAEDANELIRKHGQITVAFLDRSDSRFWRRDRAVNADFIAGLEPEPVLLADEKFSEHERMRIWRVGGKNGEPAPREP